ncbi:MAG: UvrD-helicase domain-containing protein [Succinivibrionaceae bacterium]
MQNLNNQQRKAVECVDSPCLVIAGAGSGKTKVITEKISYLISSMKYLSSNICALTFTNKAAKEMRERILSKVGIDKIKGLRICTFHSLGLDIIREEYSHLGLKKGISLFDEQDKLTKLREIFTFNYPNVENIDEEVLLLNSKIGEYKSSLKKPTSVNDYSNNIDYGYLYQQYQSLMLSYNAIDFDDLIYLSIVVFKNSSNILKKWQSRLRYILVDEYQDTNISQYEFLKLLIGDSHKFTFVGDDDQSIYSWRGARPENINLLKNDYHDLNVILLEQNYRSTSRILNCANKLISQNSHMYKKQLFSTHEVGEKIRILEACNVEDEAKKTVVEIMTHHYLYKTKYSDYAILYRGNHQSRDLEKILQDSNIPYRIIGSISFFSKQEIKDILGYLKLMSNPNDNQSFLRVINVPSRGIGPKSIEVLDNIASSLGISLLESCWLPDLKERIDNNKVFEKFFAFGNLIKSITNNINNFDSVELSHYLYNIPKEIGYIDFLYNDSKNETAYEIKINNINKIFDWFLGYVKDNLSFEEIIQKLMLRERFESEDQSLDLEEVQLLTLHSSKGLEFPYVYIVGMEEGILPHQACIDEGYIDEERRLAYVGITRAKKELTILYSLKRNKENSQYSRFLDELPLDDIIWDAKKKKGIKESHHMMNADNMFAAMEEMFKNLKK